jgi:hypothetical protein
MSDSTERAMRHSGEAKLFLKIPPAISEHALLISEHALLISEHARLISDHFHSYFRWLSRTFESQSFSVDFDEVWPVPSRNI